MGLLSHFLDRLADEHPAYAQAILDRKIGSLGQLFEDGTPVTCGCVVGTVALAAGVQPRPDCDWDVGGRWVFDVLGERLGWSPDWLDAVSLQVYHVALRLSLGPDWRHNDYRLTTQGERLTVHLVRQRIAIRLATRAGTREGVR